MREQRMRLVCSFRPTLFYFLNYSWVWVRFWVRINVRVEVWVRFRVEVRARIAIFLNLFLHTNITAASASKEGEGNRVSLSMSRRFNFSSSAIRVWAQVSSLQSKLFPRSSPNPNECMHERSKSARTLIYKLQIFRNKADGLYRYLTTPREPWLRKQKSFYDAPDLATIYLLSAWFF